MLKCTIKEYGKIKVKTKGSLGELIRETSMLIKMIHEGLYKKSPEHADEFRRTITAFVIDPNSPAFKIHLK